MALNPSLQFDETSLTAAEFDPQDKVLPNSPVESNDVNATVLRALRRTAYLRSKLLSELITQHTATFSAAYPASISTVSSSTATDTAVLVDVPNVKSGDRIDIHVSGTMILTGQTASTVIGIASLKVTDDNSGGAVNTFPTGYATIVEQVAASNTVQSFSLHAQHTAAANGTTRARVQLRYSDLSGGAGTATIALLFEARIDVTRYKFS